ncbi:hypothetical protein QBC47DRAFT_451000 [Echria macrotheca]|uniref:Uncharacterized protein n=1 Tax=Echria macrotheca TaxID=438768 RepID=A0AAJ0BI45_9PEZI|nr:hypothetical protein QBC47DRAFT_451000 [Echria macrotheca]
MDDQDPGKDPKGKGKASPEEPAEADTTERAQGDDASTLSRIARYGANDISRLGATDKASSSQHGQAPAWPGESSLPGLPSLMAPESVRPRQTQEHIAREEASFSAFLDGISIEQASASDIPQIAQQPPRSGSVPFQSEGHSTSVAEQEARDGQEVVALLSAGDDTDLDLDVEEGISTADRLNLHKALFGEGSGDSTSVVAWDNILNFIPRYLREGAAATDSSVDTGEAWQTWVDQWSRVLTGYQDEVWGNLDSLIAEARSEVQALQDVKPEEKPPQLKALLRLQAILGHLRGTVPSQGCIANFYSCADQGAVFDGTCCQNGQSCRLDQNNNPACCPNNAICTGVVAGSFTPPTATVSFVQNPYFSFPYIATSFSGPGACSQAISQCGSNYDACTAQLEGAGGFQVTVVVPDGGAGQTVVGGAGVTYPTASATSICSSLSSQACGNLQPSMCTMTGTAAGGFVFGNAAGNLPARPTLACIMAAAGVAGLGLT